MLVFCKQDSSEETWAPPITVLINWKEGASQKPITKSLQGPLQGAGRKERGRLVTAPPHPPPTRHPTCVSFAAGPTLQAHKGEAHSKQRLFMWKPLDLHLSFPGQACSLPAALSFPGCRQLGLGPVGSTGRERKGTERAEQEEREGEGAGHRGNLHIPSSPGHQTNPVAGTSKSESGPSRCQQPAAAEAMSAPGWPTWERSGKTHSMAGLPEPDAARPLVRPASTHANQPSPCRC